MLSDLLMLRAACFEDHELSRESAHWILARSVAWSQCDPWWHLPRAVAFAMIGWKTDVEKELSCAETKIPADVRELRSILRSDRDTRFAEGLENAVR